MNPKDPGITKRLRMIYEHRRDPEFSRPYADLYWRSLLVLACIVLVAAGIYSATTFFGVLAVVSSVNPQGATNKAQEVFDAKKLSKTLNGFAMRQTDFQILEKTPVPALSDPSK